MTRSRAAAFAVAASFSVYLIPLVGPHAAWFLGVTLFQGEARNSPRWIAANLAVALVFQLLGGAFFYWFFRKPGWRRAVPLVLALPVAFLALQWLYLAAIPAMFLEEPDVAPEKISWPVLCTAPDVYQTPLRTSSELWVRNNNHPNGYAVLTMPGCRLAAVTLPEPKFTSGTGVDFMIDVTSVIPGARAIVRKYEAKGAKTSWWFASGAQAGIDPGLAPLDPPAAYTGKGRPPILSTDGKYVAWLEEIPGSGPPVLNRVILRPRDPREGGKIVDLSSLGPATYSLQEVNMHSAELLLWKTEELVAVGFDGALKKEFARPAQVRSQYSTYLAAGEHWLAWDAYRDRGSYLMEWSLASGAGSHRVPLGRTIHSAAFDTSGKWIAVSVGTSLNIGKAQDAVYVLDASDGHEVFRKYLPVYSRSPVAFLNGAFFVYSDCGGVHVRRPQ